MVAAGATSATADVEDDRHHVRASSGAAERGSHRPAPVNGRFRVGSVTKAFVATAILQLVAEHKLSLDDTVDDLLPGALPAGSGITVRELLNHTSGIPEYLRTFPSPRSPEILQLRWDTWSPQELVDRVADMPLTPSGRPSYSNTNYILLGMVIEHITGKPYGATILQHIIQPLGLHDTSVPGTDPFIRGPHAHGYLPVQQADGSFSFVDITAFNPSLMGAGGEMISTTRDLNRFFDALLNGRLLPPDLMKQMKTTAGSSIYGLGIITHQLTKCGTTAWGKDGDAPGYSTWSFTSPDNHKHVTVSITVGKGDPDTAVDDLLEAELCR